MSGRISLAVDVGGSKIMAAAVRADGQLLACVERPTEAAHGAAAVLAAMAAALAELPVELTRAAVGLGISAAGVIDRASCRVVDATEAMPGWAGTDLRAHFGACLGLPVQALNDVHAALLGELAWGAARGVDSAVMLTLGTGLGGAIALRGEVLPGIAGHFGRCQLQHGGRWQPVEALVSGSGLANLYREAGGVLPAGAGAREVLADAADPLAAQALAVWVEHLAMQIHNLHWSLGPRRVLLGGGMLTARARWWPLLTVALQGLPLDVQPAALGPQAGVFGAARHLLDQVS